MATGVLKDVPDQDAIRFLRAMCDVFQVGDYEKIQRGLAEFADRADRPQLLVAAATMGISVMHIHLNNAPSAVKIAAICGVCYPRVKQITGCTNDYLYDRLCQLLKIEGAQPPSVDGGGGRRPEYDILIPVLMLFLLANAEDEALWGELEGLVQQVVNDQSGQ